MDSITLAADPPTNGKAAELFLSEAHRRELVEGSGLTDATIKAAGFYTEQSTTALSAILNRKYLAKYGAALVIPYHDESGTVILRRVKPSNPPRDAKGKPKKYLHPSDTGARVYFPRDAWRAINDPTARLVITEGEKKALAATQAGFACISLPGVNTGQRKQSTALCPDLARIEWKNREVFIAFDSDSETNEQVELASRKLAAALADRGAKVRIVRIPSADNGDKQGIDDFIMAHGAGEFSKLLAKASDPEPPDAGELKDNAKNADPATEADAMIAATSSHGLSRIRFYRGSFLLYASGAYTEVPPEEIRAEVVGSMNRRYFDVRSRYISDVMEQLKAKTLLRSSIEAPSWLGKPFAGFPAAECIATKSEVIHLPSLVDGKDFYSVPATPAFFTHSACPFDFDRKASEPTTWLRFLDSVWGDDLQGVQSLQEWFGYLLTQDTRQQKLLLIVGPKRSGKGTAARVLTALVGKLNCAAPTMNSLTTNFGLSPLVGKSVAIISDARLSGRADQSVVVERILSITGEDLQTIDRKHQSPITCRLPTRFVILSNELPRLTDASGAIVSRMILLETRRSFLGNEDLDLTDKLLAELPGILIWAIAGWQRLRQQGRFTQPDGGLESLAEINDLASPVAAFVRDCCRVAHGEVAEKESLFKAWEAWCKRNGREKYIGSMASFGRDLMAAETLIRPRRLGIRGERVQAYESISLLPEWS